MTFDEFDKRDMNLALSGQQFLHLYTLCRKYEETLDEQQQGILNELRAKLYDHFSIAQLEQIETALQPSKDFH